METPTVSNTGRNSAPSLQVYAVPISLYCAKLRILLRHKKLNWQELRPPGGYGSEQYKEIVVSGNLPALLDQDLIIADSEAAAEYLNEKYPDPPILPAALIDRARARELSRFHDTRLEPELRRLFPLINNKTTDAELVHRQSEALNQRLHQLATLLQNRSPQQCLQLSLADCGLAISFCWLDQLTPKLGLSLNWPDVVKDYQNSLMQFTAVADELNDYLPKLQQWLYPPD